MLGCTPKGMAPGGPPMAGCWVSLPIADIPGGNTIPGGATTGGMERGALAGGGPCGAIMGCGTTTGGANGTGIIAGVSSIRTGGGTKSKKYKINCGEQLTEYIIK